MLLTKIFKMFQMIYDANRKKPLISSDFEYVSSCDIENVESEIIVNPKIIVSSSDFTIQLESSSFSYNMEDDNFSNVQCDNNRAMFAA